MHKELRKPYLIQRATIKTMNPALRFSKNIDTDYMGSSEFEFGAMPKSLRRMESDFENFALITLNQFKNHNDVSLRVFFNPIKIPEAILIEWLNLLKEEKIHPKEATYFRYHFSDVFDLKNPPDSFIYRNEYNDYKWNKYRYEKCDFWWDIENDFMFSFHKKMNKLPQILQSSFQYMNEQK